METPEAKAKWSIDVAHSEISFKVKHLMISNVNGVFKEFGGTIVTSGDDFVTAEIEFSMNPASLSTGDKKRDEHLKGPEFFDVEKHKKVTFLGKNYGKIGTDGSYTLNGELTMKGVTKPIELEVEFGGTMTDPWGNEKVGYTIVGKIDRRDWGLEWNASLETGGLLVSNDVRICCDVQLLKQK